MRVIHHGLDTNHFCPAKTPLAEPVKTPFVMGMVGSIRNQYRLETLFGTSCQMGFDHRLLIVGSMTQQAKDFFAEAMLNQDLASKTTYLSWVEPETLVDCYRKMHCLFHPVDYEGCGIVPTEALACGVPVVVPAHGAPKEYVLPDGGVAVEVPQIGVRFSVARVAPIDGDAGKKLETGCAVPARLGRRVRSAGNSDFVSGVRHCQGILDFVEGRGPGRAPAARGSVGVHVPDHLRPSPPAREEQPACHCDQDLQHSRTVHFPFSVTEEARGGPCCSTRPRTPKADHALRILPSVSRFAGAAEGFPVSPPSLSLA